MSHSACFSMPLTTDHTNTIFEVDATLGSWCEFGCHDDTNALRKSTKEADKTQNFLLQFRK